MNDDFEALYQRAVHVLVTSRRASTAFLQRELGIGYNVAARLMERAEMEHIVSQPNVVGKREIVDQAQLTPLNGDPK